MDITWARLICRRLRSTEHELEAFGNPSKLIDRQLASKRLAHPRGRPNPTTPLVNFGSNYSDLGAGPARSRVQSLDGTWPQPFKGIAALSSFLAPYSHNPTAQLASAS